MASRTADLIPAHQLEGAFTAMRITMGALKKQVSDPTDARNSFRKNLRDIHIALRRAQFDEDDIKAYMDVIRRNYYGVLGGAPEEQEYDPDEQVSEESEETAETVKTATGDQPTRRQPSHPQH